MERKYQVFLSSTYTDLKEERQNITNVLLMADCIPAGMEAFVAADDEQFNIIKRVIDLCDFYILIIGDRYGSINGKTGKSYTEMEFDYALSKGIPILVFAKSVNLDNEATLESVENRAKLSKFRERALNSRLGGIWSNLGELSGQVAIAIMKAKTENQRPGWIRNLGFDPENITQELNSLRDKVVLLEKENALLRENKSDSSEVQMNLSQYKVKLHFTELQLVFTSSTPPPREIDIDTTLEEIFKHISVRISGRINDNQFVEKMSSIKSCYYVDTQQALIVKSQLVALGVLEEVNDGNVAYIRLSEMGKKEMLRLNAPLEVCL